LTVKPQPHFFAAPPSFSAFASEGVERPIAQDARITHLAFLEDNHLDSDETNSTDETAVDLRLLVVSTSTSCKSCFPCRDRREVELIKPRSNCPGRSSSIFAIELRLLQRILRSQRSVLSSRMQESRRTKCRPRRMGELTLSFFSLSSLLFPVLNLVLRQSTRLACETRLPSSAILTALSPRAQGRDLGTFIAVVAHSSGSNGMTDETRPTRWNSKLAILNS
jgi:hypothetical protein